MNVSRGEIEGLHRRKEVRDVEKRLYPAVRLLHAREIAWRGTTVGIEVRGRRGEETGRTNYVDALAAPATKTSELLQMVKSQRS